MKKFNIFVILIFILALGLRVFIMSEKNDLFFDEVLNITAANHNEFYLNKSNYFEKNKIYSGKELKQKFLFDNSSIQDTAKDIIALRKFSGDVLHTNLYYSAFRLFFTGIDKYNLHTYILRAGLLNILLFSLSFFFMFKLLNLLFDDKKYVCIGLFLAFCNPAAVSNTVFFREYQLQEMFIILLTYLGVIYFNNFNSIKKILTLSVISSFALLSGYYVGFYVFILYIVLLNKKSFKYLLGSAFLTLSLLLVMYPQYFGFFLSKFVHSKIQIAPNSSALTQIPSTNHTQGNKFFLIFQYPVSIYHYICSYLGFIYFIILSFFTRNKNKLIFSIALISLLWAVVVLTTCPYKVIRYALPAIPLCTIILTWILKCVNKNIHIIIVCLIVLFHQFCVTNNTLNKNRLMSYTNIKLYSEFCFEQNQNLPVYITVSEKERLGMFITHLNDNQKYIFKNPNDTIKDKHFYIIFDVKNPINYPIKNYKKLQNITSNYMFCAEILQ